LVRADYWPSDPPRNLQLGQQLVSTIENYITNWNVNCKLFTWTVDADTILAKVRWIESEVQKLTEH
jgi:hypothetical protein